MKYLTIFTLIILFFIPLYSNNVYLYYDCKDHFKNSKYELLQIVFRQPQKVFNNCKIIYLTTKEKNEVNISPLYLKKILNKYNLSYDDVKEINHNHSELPFPSDVDVAFGEKLYLKFDYKGKIAIYFEGNYYDYSMVHVKSWDQ